MPKALSAAAILAKNRLDSSSPWVELYRVDVGGGQFLNITNHPRPILYLGITYNPYPVRHEAIEQTQQGKIPQLVVHVANVTREPQTYLESQDGLRGKVVIIRLVNVDDPTYDISQSFVIDSVTASSQVATFVLAKTVPAHSARFPSRIVNRDVFPSLPR